MPFASSSVESLSRDVGPDLSKVFPQPTASARWVFLGPHLPLRKDRGLEATAAGQPAPLLDRWPCDRAQAQQDGPKCVGELPHNADTKAIQVCVVVTPLTSLGPASAAMPLTIPLPVFPLGVHGA